MRATDDCVQESHCNLVSLYSKSIIVVDAHMQGIQCMLLTTASNYDMVQFVSISVFFLH